MSGHIVVVGSINMDLVVRAPRHPQPGETILGTAFDTFPGGKGANQAVAAARLGGQVKMVGRVGSDSFGEALLATLQNDQVDTSNVQRTENTSTGVALITVSDSGQNNIVVVPGANGLLCPEDIQSAESIFQNASVVLLQLEIPLETVMAAVQAARRHKAQVILNPAPARTLPPELLADVDYLIPNEHELRLLSDEQDRSQASQKLLSMGIKQLIVTLGSEGVLALSESQVEHISPHQVRVVDTTAAGDAFVGGFAVALTEGKSTIEAARWGNAAGALAVTTAGAQPSLPRREKLAELLQSR